MPWFKPFGWTFRPTSPIGYLLTIGPAVFVGQVFWAVDRNAHSVSDTFYGVFPYFVATFLMWDWIARRSSETD